MTPYRSELDAALARVADLEAELERVRTPSPPQTKVRLVWWQRPRWSTAIQRVPGWFFREIDRKPESNVHPGLLLIGFLVSLLVALVAAPPILPLLLIEDIARAIARKRNPTCSFRWIAK